MCLGALFLQSDFVPSYILILAPQGSSLESRMTPQSPQILVVLHELDLLLEAALGLLPGLQVCGSLPRSQEVRADVWHH